MKKHPSLRFECKTCGASREEHCTRRTWPHLPTKRPHKERLDKLKKKQG